MKQEHSRMPGLLKNNQRSVFSCDRMNRKRSEAFDHICFTHDADSSVNKSDDDVISFIEEENYGEICKEACPWKILITDDDANVHETTMLALNGIKIHGRPLEFLHAYSAKEAKTILLQQENVALVLLDVVMETVDAGLKLVETIRTELNNHELRIVLRTGQPGYAPEEQVSHQLAIDGYTTKSKLTRSLLISVLHETLQEQRPSPKLPN